MTKRIAVLYSVFVIVMLLVVAWHHAKSQEPKPQDKPQTISIANRELTQLRIHAALRDYQLAQAQAQQSYESIVMPPQKKLQAALESALDELGIPKAEHNDWQYDDDKKEFVKKQNPSPGKSTNAGKQ